MGPAKRRPEDDTNNRAEVKALEKKEIIEKMVKSGITTDAKTGKTLREILGERSTSTIRLKIKRMAECGEVSRERGKNKKEWKYYLGGHTRKGVATNPNKIKKYFLLKNIEKKGEVSLTELKNICNGARTYYAEYVRTGEMGKKESPLNEKTFYVTKKGKEYLIEKEQMFEKMSQLEGVTIDE